MTITVSAAPTTKPRAVGFRIWEEVTCLSSFAESDAQVIDVVLSAARDIYAEAVKDIAGTAKTFSAAAGFPAPVLEVALARRGFGVQPLSDQVIAEQQKIADTFKELGLIPVAIKVSDVVRR